MRSNAQAWRRVKEQLCAVDRFRNMRDYDKPTTPANTPPAIDSNGKTGPSSQMDAKRKRDTVPHDAPAGESGDEVEKTLSPAQDGGRDGLGEAALDTPNSFKE